MSSRLDGNRAVLALPLAFLTYLGCSGDETLNITDPAPANLVSDPGLVRSEGIFAGRAGLAEVSRRMGASPFAARIE